jgi:hypothetical protein
MYGKPLLCKNPFPAKVKNINITSQTMTMKKEYRILD